MLHHYFSVATPVISASNSATDYEISGTSVTLTCESTSDPSGSGKYLWKLDGNIRYVLSAYLDYDGFNGECDYFECEYGGCEYVECDPDPNPYPKPNPYPNPNPNPYPNPHPNPCPYP